VWAPYWYNAVLRSSGFEPYRVRERQVPQEYQGIIDAVMPAFDALFVQRMALH
jgi:hypothetical protein